MKIKKGLDLPIKGKPKQTITNSNKISKVAILGEDYISLKPSLNISLGDQVAIGDVLFSDKKNPKIKYTSPAGGKIIEINRGEKRVLQSIVIEIDKNEKEKEFKSYTKSDLKKLSKKDVTNQLLESGLWTSIRQRPFSKVANPDEDPSAIFLTLTDTNPLCPDPNVIINSRIEDFVFGVLIIEKLTSKTVHICQNNKLTLPALGIQNYQKHNFDGVHPAGNVGTHIHMINPVSATKTVWHIGYQDIITIGHLFSKGKLDPKRVVSLAGPCIKEPRLLTTRLGACLSQIVQKQTNSDEDLRIISGSVLNGTTKDTAHDYLGRYHNQVTVLEEGYKKEFFGWLRLGNNKFSLTKAFLHHLTPKKEIAFTTSTGGSDRAMIPIGNYERVMPLDIYPTMLFRDMIAGDTESAQALGCLELDEEDIALCSVVCPGKYEFGSILRNCLNQIEKEG